MEKITIKVRIIVMPEEILSFLPSQFTDPAIYWVELAGTTYPFATYHVERTHSSVTTIEYVQSGRGHLTVDQQHYTVQGGDAYVLPAGHDHHYASDPAAPMQKIWVNVSGSLCSQLLDTYQLTGQVVFPHYSIEAELQDYLAFCRLPGLTPEARSERGPLLLHQVVLALHRFSAQHALAQQHPQAAAVRAYLDNHLGDTITLNALSRQFHLSVSQLTREFARVYSATPYAYLLNRRVAMAKMLLTHTGLTVGQIAQRLAFTDAHYFSNVFLEKTGQRPLAWSQATQ